MDEEFKVEKEHLKEVIFKYEDILEDEELRLDNLPRMYGDNPRLLDKLLHQTEHKIYIMRNSIEKPYFARIDFQEEGIEHIDKCYIGKVGIIDEDAKVITIDWRAPIASMYYDSNIGNTEYKSPNGIIKGQLFIKRQYEIENSKLLNFQDVDIVSNDDILKPFLGVSADSRLKNIVSSIQQEQNDIIRKDIYDNLIIQGVAGSGKTTVALHRIAYLVYNNIDKVNPEQYMVIGPNKFFLNYISGVLPDLDVTNVSQLTYEELVKKIINEKFIVTSDDENIKNFIHSNKINTLNRIKTSLKYKNALDKFIEEIKKDIVPQKDFCIRDYKIVDNIDIKNIYDEIDQSIYYNIESIVEQIKIRMLKIINDNKEKIILDVNEKMSEKFEKTNSDKIKKQIIKDADFVKKELNKNCTSSLNKFFSISNIKILSLYNSFLNNLDNYIKLDDNMIKEKNDTLKKLKKKIINFEDLAGILYLKYKMSENKEYRNFRYIVIDEAQDFGELNFYVLIKIMKNAKFSIFGDLAQSIYDFRSIDNWEDVCDLFNNDISLMYLQKSYRTTTEIMNEANRVIHHIGLKESIPVIRHGRNVEYIKEENLIEQIKHKIVEYKELGHKSIAIISKSIEETTKINNYLKDEGIYAYNIIDDNIDYESGICTITSYLSKGLEFDAVILSNASEKIYKDNNLDMKLLYVSLTRALHDLCIIYTDNITKPLINYDNNQKPKQS